MAESQATSSMDAPFIKLPSRDSSDSSTSGARVSPDSAASLNSTEASTPPASPPPEPSTHNTSKARYHVKDIAEFANALQISADRALPNRERSRYTEVKALLLRWDEDHLRVEQELDTLASVFRDYGFETEIWLIPTVSPDRKITRKILDFVENYENEDTLLVVYYGGHATINQARQATWSCKRDVSYSSFEWNGIQRLFETSKSDTLLLLDCCSAAAAATASTPAQTDSVTEIIAACGWETWAPRPGRLSLTNALIAVLQDRQTPFSAAMLHSEVLAFLKQPRPRPYDREISKTPVYVLASSDPKKYSIEISRRRNPEPSSENHETLSPTIDRVDLAANSPPTTPSDNISNDSSQFIKTLPDNSFVLPHVIMSIALEADQDLDVRAFAQWLRQFPALAQYAKIQGVYRGYSTLVIAALPVVIWNLLPENPAYNFVGYTRSDNLMHSKPVQKPIKRKSSKASSTASARQDSVESKKDISGGGAPKVEAKDHGSKSKSKSKDNSSLSAQQFTGSTDILTQSIDRALRKNANLPARNWALAVMLENGTHTNYTSQRLAPYRTRLFNSRFNHDFQRYTRGTEDSFPNSGYASDISSASTLVFGRSKYRSGSIDSRIENEQLDEDSDSFSAAPKRFSQRVSVSAPQILATLTQSEAPQPKDLSDSHGLESFYFTRFNDLQQAACRQLARAFVKLIEPERGLQSHYPYRSGTTPAPEWWPSTRGVNAVRHKEPDHLLKTERITLLVHILWQVARPREKQPESIQKLDLDITRLEQIAMNSLQGWFADQEHPENVLKKVILKEIFEVAKAEERFQRDGGPSSREMSPMTSRESSAASEEIVKGLEGNKEANVIGLGAEESLAGS